MVKYIFLVCKFHNVLFHLQWFYISIMENGNYGNSINSPHLTTKIHWTPPCWNALHSYPNILGERKQTQRKPTICIHLRNFSLNHFFRVTKLSTKKQHQTREHFVSNFKSSQLPQEYFQSGKQWCPSSSLPLRKVPSCPHSWASLPHSRVCASHCAGIVLSSWSNNVI